RCRVTATGTGGRTALHCAFELRVFEYVLGIRLVYPAVSLFHDNAEINTSRRRIGDELQSEGAIGLRGEPEGTDKRHFGAAARAFASDSPRPEVSDRRRAVGVFWVELGQFLLGLTRDPLPPLADFIGEALAVFGDVLKDDLVEQDRDRIQVAGKG